MKSEVGKKLGQIHPKKILAGFDGFVDEVVHVVKTRIDSEHFIRMETIREYGEFIARASGLSANVEIVTIQKKIGGNGPIFALAMKMTGNMLVYIGGVGLGQIDPVFHALKTGSRIIGVAEPGKTDAMEFLDGKLIRSKLESLNDVSWESIMKQISARELADITTQTDLLMFGNWSLLVHMNAIYQGFLRNIFPQVPNLKDKTVFFDLADPEKRNREEIIQALDIIREFGDTGICTVLGLNLKESCEIAELLGMKIPDIRSQPPEPLAEFLYRNLHVRVLVIHPIDCACSVDENGFAMEKGPYCERPVLTTGAGDHFNAGFMLGRINGFSPRECLLLGNATSGYYVRKGYSPDIESLQKFLISWENGDMD